MFKRYCIMIGITISVLILSVINGPVFAEGEAGQTATGVQTVPGGPSVTELYPQPDSTVASTAPKFSLRFSDSDKLDARVVLTVDQIACSPQIKWDGIYQAYVDSCTGETIEVRVADDYTKGVITAQLPTLAPGIHSVYYKMSDKLGNTTSQTYNFYIADIAGPKVMSSYPQENSTIDIVKPNIKVTLTDDNSIVAESVYLSLNGVKVAASYDFLNSTITYAVPEVLANGIHTLEVRADDIFGNTMVKTWNFTISIDRTPPQISNLNPASGGTISSLSPVVSFRFYDPGGIIPGSAQIKIDDNPVNVVVTYDGIYRTEYDSCTGQSYQVRIGDDYKNGIVSAQAPRLATGQHSFYFRIADDTENVVENHYTFTVADTSGPQVTECFPAEGAVLSNDKPVIKVKMSDSNRIVSDSVYLGLNGTRLNSTYDPNSFTITYAVPERLANGSYTLQFSAKDELENWTNKTWSFTVNADQSGPQFKDMTPVPEQTVISVKPSICVNFTDTSQVDLNTVVMKLNGATVTPVTEYEGIYQTDVDTCTGETYTVKIGEDNTKGKISYQPTALENNKVYTVDISLGDKLGNASSCSWSFKVLDDLMPNISPLTPGPDSVIEEPETAITAQICDDNGLKTDTVKMTFNGEVVGSFDSIRGIVSYKPAVPLLDGHYTVQVEVYDVFDNYGSANWAFDVRHLGLPEISDLLPPPQSGTRITKPTVSAKVKDNGGIDAGKLSVNVDGIPLVVSFRPDTAGSVVSGTVYAVSSQALNTGMHTAVLTVFDRAGNKEQKTWVFGVNQFGDMAVANKDCSVCHTESIDTIERRHIAGADDCNLCHGRGIDWDPGCCYCHGHDDSYPPPVRNVPCVQCHNQTYWDAVPTHGSPAELSTHNDTGLQEDCRKCHSPYLTREHNLFVEGSGIKFDCNTCHQSTRTEVQQAISAGVTACSACHPASDHESVHLSGVDDACLDCHQESLTADHIDSRPESGLGCETCHDSANSKYSQAVENNNKQCAVCHSEFHSLGLSETAPADLPQYSGFVWSQPLKAGVFANDSSSPDGFTDGQVVLSNRRSDVTFNELWSFYQENFAAGGWTQVSGEPALDEQYFIARFTKDYRAVLVRCYNTQNGDGTGGKVDTGYRIEIWYK